MVVQRYGGAGPQQEHPHAEHLRLADVHVGDRRGAVLERQRGGRAAVGSPRGELQVRRPHFRHQALQFALVLQERFSGVFTEPNRTPVREEGLSGDSLDDGSHVAVTWHHTGARSGGPVRSPLEPR